MQRTVFERIGVDGYKTNRVESIAACSNGHRLFVGTGDGALVVYDCQTSLSSTAKFNCNLLNTIRPVQKEKKPVSHLTIVESWGIIIGIVDGVITSYDITSFQLKSSLLETKGCHVFSVHEYNGIIAVAIKRKISLYTWMQTTSNSNFYLRKEVSNLAELPKIVVCVSNALIVGFKRSYEALDMNSLASTKILDVDKDQRMLCLELPSSELRQSAIILAHGIQGLVFDLFKVISNPSTAMFNERLEWKLPPISINYISPFIVSLLPDYVEIHDVISLSSLQQISLPSNAPSLAFTSSMSAQNLIYSFSSCEIDTTNGIEYGYISSIDTLSILRMTPLSSQIVNLLDASRFEEAINLCILCSNNPQLREIDIQQIHEKYALSLFQRGDFEGSISNYIKADTSPIKVIALFPELVPAYFHNSLGLSASSSSRNTAISVKGGSVTSNSKMSGMILQKAASAIVQFCEYHRNQWRDKIEAADKLRSGGSSAEGVDFNGNPEDFLKDVEVVDTVLLSALLNCSPPRRNAVVELLSQTSPVNRCHMESSTALIASQGNAFTEALLWLYRSHNEHKKVLVALTEDRCVGQAAWSREQFYNWTAEYLRWLWCSDDIGLPMQALNALRPVLEYDAELGLSVLTSRPKQSRYSVIGGKDVDIHDILTFLESVRPKPPPKGSFGQSVSSNLRRSSTVSANTMGVSMGGSDDAPFLRIPLINGRALGVTYLEWRVNNGTAPAASHNEYAQLLMEGIPLDIVFDHNSNALDIKSTDDDSITLYKIYRKKLQYFLQTSTDYNPEKILKFLPSQFLHEYSLILSKLGKHDEVLKIYVNQMKDLQIAESYCDRIYRRSIDEKLNMKNKSNNNKHHIVSTYAADEEGVYLILIKVLLSSEINLKSNKIIESNDTNKKIINNIEIVINIAERYYDRINTVTFLNELPRHVPVTSIARYLNIVMEYSNNTNKNLQVVHQLLRVREVNIRTNINDSNNN